MEILYYKFAKTKNPPTNTQFKMNNIFVPDFSYLHCLHLHFEHFSLSGYCYPESDHFPDSNNRKVKIVQT